jgi:hypothetical protein
MDECYLARPGLIRYYVSARQVLDIIVTGIGLRDPVEVAHRVRPR